MIEAGWETDCPSCGSTDRLGAHFETALKDEHPSVSYRMFQFQGPKGLPLVVFADICIHCGTLYAYQCAEQKGVADAAPAS